MIEEPTFFENNLEVLNGVISSYIKIISILNLITQMKKWGLIICINYTGSSSELNDCINNAQILKIFLT
jgi:hypothetical protein